MSEVTALELLLSARYVGGGAFRQMQADIAGLSTATSGFSRMGQAFKAAGDVMIAAGVAVGVGLAYATKAAGEYETAINRIVAVTPDLQKHSQLVAQLNSQVGAAASTYGINPSDIAKGSYFLFSSLGALGASPGQLLNSNVISQLAQYSRASGWPNEGGVSFGDAAQVLPRLFAASNSPMSAWGGNMGILTYLENQAHTTQSQLASSLNTFLPIMTSLNIPFGEAATLMAATGSSGRVGAPAGREFMSALTLMMSGGPQQRELAALGLSNKDFYSGGKLRPTDQIMQMLQAGIYTHAKSPSDVLSIEHALFGQVGLRALGPLLSPGGFQKYQNLLGGEKQLGILNNPKAAEAYMRVVAGNMMQSPGSQWDRFKASMQLLAITIGDKVLPPLMRLGNMVDNLALKLVGLVNAHPQLASALALGAVPGLLGGGLGLKGMGGLFSMLGMADSGILAGNARKAAALPKALDALTKEYEQELMPFTSRKGVLRLTKGETTDKKLNYGDFSMMRQAYQDANEAAMKKYAPAPTVMEQMLSPFKSLAGAGSRAALGIPGFLRGVPGALGGALDRASFAAFPQLRLAHAGAAGLGFGEHMKFMGAGLGQDVVAHGKALKEAVVSLPGKGVDALKGMWEAFKKLGPLIKTAGTALLGFGGAALPIIAIVLLVVGAIAIGILMFTKFRTQTMAALQPLFKEMSSVFNSIKEMIGGAIQQIQKTWNQMWPQIRPAMIQFLAAVKQMGPVWTVLGTIIKFVVGIILTVIVGLVSGFLKALPAIIGVFTGIIQFITGVTSLIVDIFTGKWGKIPGDISKIFQGIWHIIVSLLGAVLSFIGGFIMGVLNFFNKMTHGALQGVIDWIHSLVGWFRNIPAWVRIHLAALVYTVTQKFNEMKKAGGDLIMGLVTGVAEKEQQLVDAVKKAVGNAIGGAKHLLGIASPSKVFHELGHMTVLGYTQGIQAHARDIDSVHSLFGLGRVGTLKVDNLQVPGQQPQRDNLEMFKFANYADAQRQRRMTRYSPDLDSLAYQERIGSQYTA